MHKDMILTQAFARRPGRSALAGLVMLLGCSSGQAYDSEGESYYGSRHAQPKYNTVYKCHDSKGNVVMSNFECPSNTKMVGRQDIKVREQREYNRYANGQDWRYSQYNRPDYGYSYSNYALRNRPNAAEVNAKYREAERQAEWDGWKNKDRNATEAKLASLESQRKAELNRGYDYLR